MNWTHVSESLPEIGVAVLLTDGNSILVGQREDAAYRAERGEKTWRWTACGVSGYEWDWDFDDYYTSDPVTHWMPLPDMPIYRAACEAVPDAAKELAAAQRMTPPTV